MADHEITEASENVEKKDLGDRTSENTSSDAVIGGDRQDHQKIHSDASKAGQTFETFSDNNDDQSFKAIQPAAESFGIDFGDGTVETAKGKTAKPATEGAFDSATYVSRKSHALNTKSVPIELDDPGIPEDTVIADYPGTEHPKPGDVLNPFRNHEDEAISECTKENPKAWEYAYHLFPKLHNHFSRDEATNLMKALMRNELYFYDSEDAKQDRLAHQGDPQWGKSLGYTQITPKGIREFETGIQAGQKVREPYDQLTRFLAQQGYRTEGHETSALLDSDCLPMIMAAKLSTLVELYEKHNERHPDQRVQINTRSLAYGYNADVYQNREGKPNYHAITDKPSQMFAERIQRLVKAFPPHNNQILAESVHLKNVEKQLKHYSGD